VSRNIRTTFQGARQELTRVSENLMRAFALTEDSSR